MPSDMEREERVRRAMIGLGVAGAVATMALAQWRPGTTAWAGVGAAGCLAAAFALLARREQSWMTALLFLGIASSLQLFLFLGSRAWENGVFAAIDIAVLTALIWVGRRAPTPPNAR